MSRKTDKYRNWLNEIGPGSASMILIEAIAYTAVKSRNRVDRYEAQRLLCFAVAKGYRYPGKKAAHLQAIARITEFVDVFGANRKHGEAAIAAIREAAQIASNAPNTKRMIRQSRRICKARAARWEADRAATIAARASA